MKIADYFLKRKTDQLIRKGRLQEAVMVPIPEVKDIGILFLEEEGQHQALNQFVEGLMKDHKRVRALTFFENYHSNPYQFKFDFFTKKEISLFGDIQNEKVSQFIDFRFDYLFCVSRQVFLPFEYILMQSHAKFRVGFHEEGKEYLFDLMVEPPQDASLQTLLAQLYEYTQKISLSLHEH
ncbi:hypothetical protein QNI19_32385 [Cytophagaceae bacterium DM2B3-1]|uniref:Uncharacterized protein n=1 Tax=Xanthocytophaga flava TaxID=3048013 RepID=A0ABT7CV81_9BACT|nr:hypothetical protein [Xanthocytophaga flavus]MDJ1473261.1 hypothetical protein [Xanthocytophaga flavus]MDJ1497683.1 hypothetical protein [Xanthocytophaga flavus]